MISKAHAQSLGLLNANGQPVRSPDFHLPLGGVSGKQINAPGFRIESLEVTTASGRVLRYQNVPVVVHDISTKLDNGQTITLDGLFGLNLLLPGTQGASGLIGALTGNASSGGSQGDGPVFEAAWIDGPRGRLLLDQARGGNGNRHQR